MFVELSGETIGELIGILGRGWGWKEGGDDELSKSTDWLEWEDEIL